MTCSVESCEREHYARSWCRPHYNRVLKTGSPGDKPIGDRSDRTGECSVDGCSREIRVAKLCSMHYQRKRVTGETGPAQKSVRNKSGWITPQGYRYFKVDGKTIAEQRLVMRRHLDRPLLPEETVHHINGDRLDNRIENLELWSSNHPSGQRVSDKVEWAKELLALYEPEALTEGVNGG